MLIGKSQLKVTRLLLQENQPVAFASGALALAESRYAQIENELSSVGFAWKRFDTHLNGRDVVHVKTDDYHKLSLRRTALPGVSRGCCCAYSVPTLMLSTKKEA